MHIKNTLPQLIKLILTFLFLELLWINSSFASPSEVYVNSNSTDKNSNIFVDIGLEDRDYLLSARDTLPSNALNIFSHGKSGQLYIENKWHNASSLTEWFHHNFDIASYDQINIFGCEFGKGIVGELAVEKLELALGVPIAASNDITGGEKGDWQLEVGEGLKLINSNESNILEKYQHSLQIDDSFECNGSAYATQALSGTSSNFYIIPDATIPSVRTELPLSKPGSYNGIAYNAFDNYIYGTTIEDISGSCGEGKFVRIGSNNRYNPTQAIVECLADPVLKSGVEDNDIPIWKKRNSVLSQGLESGFMFSSGALSADGNTYFLTGSKYASSDSKDGEKVLLGKVNLLDTPYTYETIELSTGISPIDMAFSQKTNKLYAFSRGNVVSIDPANGAVEVETVTANPSSPETLPSPLYGSAGGAWRDNAGDVYFNVNSVGSDGPAMVLQYDPWTNMLQKLQDTDNASRYDATACIPLALSKGIAIDTSDILNGDTVTYTIEITNPNSSAVNVYFEDVLNEGLNIIEGSLKSPTTLNYETVIYPTEGTTDNKTIITGLEIPTIRDNDGVYAFSFDVVINDVPNGGDCIENIGSLKYGNNDTVTSTNESGESAPTSFCLAEKPELELMKVSALVGGDGEVNQVGDVILYTFTVTNVGNMTIYTPTITDENLDITNLQVFPSPMLKGETRVVTATYSVTQDDLEAGKVVNTAIISGSTENGDLITDTSSNNSATASSPTVTPLIHDSGLELLKVASYTSDNLKLGDIISYTFVVTNVGNVSVTLGSIEDEKLGITLNLTEKLLPGSSTSTVATYSITQEDINAGEVVNIAIVKGTDSDGDAVSDTSSNNADTANSPTVTPLQVIVDDDSGSIPYQTASTVSITNNDTLLPKLGTLTIITPSSDGTVMIDDNGTPEDPSDDQLVFTPNDGFSGATTLVYEVCAANGTTCDTATVTLIVLEPTATPEDQDGVGASVEQIGPSGDGDFNSDGIIDSLQTAVVTLLDCPEEANTCDSDQLDQTGGDKDWVAITLLDANNQPLENCSAFRNTFTAQEGATGIYGPQDPSSGSVRSWSIGEDNSYYYPFGLVGFSIECDEPNQVVSGVKTYFFGAGTDAAKAGLGDKSYTVRKYADVGGPANGAKAAFQNMGEMVTMSSGMEMVDFSVAGSRTVSSQREAFVITTTLADESAGDSSLGQVSGKYRIFDPHGPALPSGDFIMSKSVNKSEANIGDLLVYTLKVENKSARTGTFKIYDKLPAGLNLLDTDGKATRSPSGNLTVGSEDGYVSFTDNGEPFLLVGNSQMTISYFVQVGPGAIKGEISNLAFTGSSPSDASSNVAKAVVTIMANDPIFDLSTVIGKVFNDLNENGSQDPGEHGLPGVRLATVSGEVILTDANGRYHIPAVESDIGGNGKNYILKLDEASLPSCARVISENPRVLRLTAGLMSRMDFAVNVGTTKPAKPAKPGEKRTLLDTIYFQNAKDEISIDQLQRLDAEISRYLQDPNVSVRISGHTDSDPLRSGKLKKQFGDNYGLSQNRARVVGEEIISKLNLPRDRIEFAGYGPDRPVASNKTEEGQARNRRTEIEVITYTKGESGASRGGSCSAETVGVVEILRHAGTKSRAAIAQPLVKNDLTPVRVVLKDSFFTGTSTIPKNLDNISKIAHALQSGGGELHIISTDQNLASRRAAILNNMLSDTLGDTAMSRIQIRSSAQ
jgi:uncharacterized repeat protein (TIGR01451 family)/fimbrial isopeptide formation D2 family protein